MRKHLLNFLFIVLTVPVIAQSGIVFRDGNGSGTKDAGERGMPKVKVTSFINNGVGDAILGTATTDDYGNYSLSPAAATGQKVRIEFELSSAGCIVNGNYDYEAHKASLYGSAVQFVTGPATGINFGVYHPQSEYIESNNPTLYSSVFNGGNPQDPSVQQTDAILGFKYLNSGIPGDTINGSSAKKPSPSLIATTKDVGSNWGIAYALKANKLFTSAFLKRHAGLGPLGSGGIYMIDPTKAANTNVTPFFSLDTDFGIATQGTGPYQAKHPGFSSVIGTNTERKLKGLTDLTTDAAAFDQVGKVSLGGLELSEDGRYLFVINLYDRKLYRFDLKDAHAPQKPTAADVKVYDTAPWLTATCPSGEMRPFALKYHKDKIYVGTTCTGENLGKSVAQYSAVPADQVLSSKIYELDPSGTGTGTQVLDIPLTYPKNLASKFDNGLIRGWYNWADNFSQLSYSHGNGLDSTWQHPQPMLVDIEFDIDGSMIVAYSDRTGHQMGWRNHRPTQDTLNRVSATVSGDILRAWKNPTSCNFELENNGKAGLYTTAGKDKSVTAGGYGSGYGEYYFGDDAYTLSKTQPWHGESVIGGLAIVPASGEVIAGAFDPLDGRLGKPYSGIANGLRASFSGGFIRLNNVTGDKETGYSLYTAAGFGKAVGIGDMELASQLAPIALGNRIWDDTDADGVQDADEDGINGVVLGLFKNNIKIGETISNNDGNWYFDSTNVILNGTLGIEPNTDYEIRLDSNAFFIHGSGILTNYYLTFTGKNGQGISGASDNDATYDNGLITIKLTTGELGYTNNNLDFGMTQNPPCSFTAHGLDSLQCNDNNTPYDESDDYLTFSLDPTGVNLWINYKVKVSKGSIQPDSADIGVPTRFRLQDGSAGGGNVVLTIYNPIDTACNITVNITDPGSCKTPCPTTNYAICPGEIYRLEIEDPNYVNVQWYIDQGNGVVAIPGANSLIYNATEPGIYTYTASNANGCNGGSCCPTILVAGTNCCKPKICAPVRIIKK
jgi:hypothetical protein